MFNYTVNVYIPVERLHDAILGEVVRCYVLPTCTVWQTVVVTQNLNKYKLSTESPGDNNHS